MPYSTHSFKANTVGVGFSKTLDSPAGRVSITNDTTDEIFIKVGSGTAPATPTNAYIPGNDAWTSTLGIKAATTVILGEDYEGKGFIPGMQEKIEWVAGWCVAAGKVNVVGH